MELINISKSTNPNKKYMALFKISPTKTKLVHFGASGYNDYIIYSSKNKELADKKKLEYIARHKIRENFNDPLSPGSLSRWILWNKPSLSQSVTDFINRFDL